MSQPSHRLHPSLESGGTVGETTQLRPSLFNTKDDFIERIAPVGVAAIFFGSFSLAPRDVPLSRQALFKLSFLYRHFLQPAGIQIVVNRQTAVLTGAITSPVMALLAEILARQIEGIRQIKDETSGPKLDTLPPTDAAREATQFLFATDQTLRSSVHVHYQDGIVSLQGDVTSAAQKTWAESLGEATGCEMQSLLKINESAAPPIAVEPPQLDDESLQALILVRLHLVRATEHLPVKVKAVRGVVALQGKVRTEALRQRVENITRSTLGLRELRSSLSVSE